MKKYIIVKHTSPKCWRVYISDEDGNELGTSITEYFFDEEEARRRAIYMTTFNDVVGILLIEEVE